MKIRYWIVSFSLLALWGMSGCCEKCERQSLGDFALTPLEETWLEFAETQDRNFRNALTGDQVLFKYSDVLSGIEDQLVDCEDLGKCGFCCNSFGNPFRFIQLRSSDGNTVFDLTLRKDFQNFSPQDDPNEIKAYLSITFNNYLSCTLFNIPDTVLTEDVNLSNKDFFNVFTCEFENSNSLSLPGEPLRFYFNKVNGIVAFEVVGEAENEIWILVD